MRALPLIARRFRLLVALLPVRDLLLFANHLFVAARTAVIHKGQGEAAGMSRATRAARVG
jgi:hypothetical protein